MPVELPDPIRVALLVARVFDELGVRHCVGGSVASSIHGEPRSTDDVDVVAALGPEHAAPFVERLTPEFFVQLDAVREAIASRSSFNAIHLSTVHKVDVFVLSGEPFARAAMERRVRIPVGDAGALSVSSAEDIVLQKLLWYRAAGDVSEKQWRDVAGVLKVQAERLDRAYLSGWAGRLGVADLLERAVRAAGLS